MLVLDGAVTSKTGPEQVVESSNATWISKKKSGTGGRAM